LWAALREAFPQTGLWPIIRGDVTELYVPEDPPDIEAIMARAPAGSIRQVLADRCAQMCERNGELVDGLDPQKSFERLADAVDPARIYAFIGSDFEVPDWPGKPLTPETGFHATRGLSMVTLPDRVECTEVPLETVGFALVRLEHPYEAPARLGFLGGEDVPAPELIVAAFREWEREYGAVPACITNDYIECVVDRPPQTPADAYSLGVEQWIFCEDIIAQGTHSVRGLAIHLWRSPQWYFWWD
jgi:hypothetical protein